MAIQLLAGYDIYLPAWRINLSRRWRQLMQRKWPVYSIQ